MNGKKISVKQKSGSYIAITREWKDGDQISATYPMQIKLETTPDNPDKAALLYGPLVLAGERGTEGMQAPAPFSNPALYNDYYTYNFHVPAHLRTSLKLDKKHPERALQRVGSDLKFTTEQGDVIRPLYDLHHQRYVVYWGFTIRIIDSKQRYEESFINCRFCKYLLFVWFLQKYHSVREVGMTSLLWILLSKDG